MSFSRRSIRAHTLQRILPSSDLRKSPKVNAKLPAFYSCFRRTILTYIPAKDIAINPDILRSIISYNLHAGGLAWCSIFQRDHTLQYEKCKATRTDDIHQCILLGIILSLQLGRQQIWFTKKTYVLKDTSPLWTIHLPPSLFNLLRPFTHAIQLPAL